MTLTFASAARSVQIVGLAAALMGAAATVIAPFCGSSIWGAAGVFGAALDAAAIVSRSRKTPIGLSILKLPIVFGPILIILSCGYVALPQPPIPTDLGPNLIMLSSVPSVLGALLRSALR
jgi:hypothetical protein